MSVRRRSIVRKVWDVNPKSNSARARAIDLALRSRAQEWGLIPYEASWLAIRENWIRKQEEKRHAKQAKKSNQN